MLTTEQGGYENEYPHNLPWMVTTFISRPGSRLNEEHEADQVCYVADQLPFHLLIVFESARRL